MRKMTCPSCGAPYNGKRCRSCSYEHFSEEIAHGNHTHRGEPLVIDAPVRKPLPRKDPFDCDRKARKKHPLLRFLVLLTLINSLMPMLRNWGLKLEAIEESHRTAAREPVVPAEDMVTLYRNGDIHIFTSAYDAEHFADSLTLYVQNDSRQDVTVYSTQLLINNYVIQDGSLYCEAGGNAIGKTWLYRDEELLKKAGISRIQSVSFRLEAFTGKGDFLFTTDLITLGQMPDTFPESEGSLLYEQDGLRVRYLGYNDSPFQPEVFADGALEFCLENTSEDTCLISVEKAAINGEPAGIYLLAELPPGTRTIAEGLMYDVAAAEIRSPMDALLELSLNIRRNDDHDSALVAGPFRFPAAVALDWEDASHG